MPHDVPSVTPNVSPCPHRALHRLSLDMFSGLTPGQIITIILTPQPLSDGLYQRLMGGSELLERLTGWVTSNDGSQLSSRILRSEN